MADRAASRPPSRPSMRPASTCRRRRRGCPRCSPQSPARSRRAPAISSACPRRRGSTHSPSRHRSTPLPCCRTSSMQRTPPKPAPRRADGEPTRAGGPRRWPLRAPVRTQEPPQPASRRRGQPASGAGPGGGSPALRCSAHRRRGRVHRGRSRARGTVRSGAAAAAGAGASAAGGPRSAPHRRRAATPRRPGACPKAGAPPRARPDRAPPQRPARASLPPAYSRSANSSVPCCRAPPRGARGRP